MFQVKSGTIFDNILVTDSVEYAETFAKETFEKTKEGEKKMKDEQDEKERKEREAEEKKAKEEEDKKKAEEEDEEEEEEEEVGRSSLYLSGLCLHYPGYIWKCSFSLVKPTVHTNPLENGVCKSTLQAEEIWKPWLGVLVQMPHFLQT